MECRERTSHLRREPLLVVSFKPPIIRKSAESAGPTSGVAKPCVDNAPTQPASINVKTIFGRYLGEGVKQRLEAGLAIHLQRGLQ